ncbi:uncharacterized protein LOC143291649 isoform X2 [Babylonia areolata]|uniref:uncharacterized protein LOC143291649 isoform X2 n=1 Tax=Babylonia areolata TaxID=304850 RepID=UPI003FD5CAD8
MSGRLNRHRAASEKLPSCVYGTMVSKDQLRRQLSERVQSPQANTDEPISPRRQVRFEDNSPTVVKQPVQISSSFVERRTTLSRATSQKSPDYHRQVSSPTRREEDGEEGSLEALVSLYDDGDGKVKGVVELSTLRQRRVPCIKVRVICLIDVSGSMLLKGDKRQCRSKISILQKMAVDVIDALEDEEDFFGVLTFGEETRVLCPLTRVTASMRTHVKSTVSELNKNGGFSAVTDLSSALLQAVEMLTVAQQDEGLLYRNCIIVFSDGEVNAGETDPRELVHVTRDKMRQCHLPPDVQSDLWVNVSCVTTGAHFSHSLYLLSKMCGSDAYFYVDGSKNFPEADMLIPLMLRKTACAQMVSVTVRAGNGASLDTARCSQEYSVRRRSGREVERGTMTYFIHDLPSGIKKTFQLSVHLDQSSSSSPPSAAALDEDFLSVDVQYVDPLGVLYTINKSIHRQEVLSLTSCRDRALETVVKRAKTQMRSIMQVACRQVAAELERSQDTPDDDLVQAMVNAAVEAGKKEVEELAQEVLSQLEDGHVKKEEFEQFARALQANLNKLRSLVQTTAAGRCWQYTKAMSSAVARELPTVSCVLSKSSTLCPLPRPRGCDSKRTQALSIFVLGEEEEDKKGAGEYGNLLHNAAHDVARSLADVLKAVETSSL